MPNNLKSLGFIKTHDDHLYLRLNSGIYPVAYFSANLKVNKTPFRAEFALDYNGNLQHSDCPFEELCVLCNASRIYIKGTKNMPTVTDRTSVQGVLKAIIPGPENDGNQYLIVFIDQRKKSSIYTCSGTDKNIGTIYNALAAIETYTQGDGKGDQEFIYEE